MTAPLAELDTSKRVLKRAQYEAFEFTIVKDGVLVRNGSHADPENHEYLVTVDGSLPDSCECPAHAKYDGACKHRVAVAIRTPILDAAVHQQLAADGGTPTKSYQKTSETAASSHSSESTAVQSGRRERDSAENESGHDYQDNKGENECSCDGLPDKLPCWECVRSGRRALSE